MQTFVVDGDEICAALTTEKPEIDNIRVLLMTTNFKSLFHPEITLVCDSMAVLEYGDEKDKKDPVCGGWRAGDHFCWRFTAGKRPYGIPVRQ